MQWPILSNTFTQNHYVLRYIRIVTDQKPRIFKATYFIIQQNIYTTYIYTDIVIVMA